MKTIFVTAIALTLFLFVSIIGWSTIESGPLYLLSIPGALLQYPLVKIVGQPTYISWFSLYFIWLFLYAIVLSVIFVGVKKIAEITMKQINRKR